MKIALLGYGRMGKAIEKIALSRGHEIIFIKDKNTVEGNLQQADVAINFSVPEAAVENLKEAFAYKIPVVCGTTGWLAHKQKIDTYCLEQNTAFLYASNFSIGVNLFFKLNKIAAKLMGKFNEQYPVYLDETHHIHKIDAPSGTAISLAEDIIQEIPQYTSWDLDPKEPQQLRINAHREKEVPGTHEITYASPIDEIKLTHKANSREGFALGAIIAAEWLQNKTGIFTMEDVLNL